MQTTLLGFAIAIILALLTALVGPLFIDWNSHRVEFEARASRLTGLDVRVTGPIDARLLPTPSLTLHGIEFGGTNEVGQSRARAMRIEFALGSLVRGEWRIRDARLEGPEFAAGLDGSGRLTWPVPKIGFDPEGVAIESLTIRDGRAVLADATSGSRLILDKLEFKGELRSLAGPVKGEGSFAVAGQRYPYRVITSRFLEGKPARVRLTLDPIDRPLTADVDVSISFERGAPRFEGSVLLARPVGRAPAGAQALIIEPWRLSSRIKGDAAAATLEQIEFQYGPDERATKLRGNATLTFGRLPEIVGALSSTHLDLDRILALSEAARRRPLAALKALAENSTAALQLPMPATLTIGVDTVTLGGAMLHRLGAEVRIEGDHLDIGGLEFRAPGVTQVRLKGRLGQTAAGAQFAGSTRVEAGDPRALIAWLTDRSDAQAAAGALRLGGEITVGNGAIVVDRLALELDRMMVAGRFGYAWANGSRPARLDAALTTPEIDLHRAHTLAKAMLGEAVLDWPREGALSLQIARAFVADVEAKQVDVKARIDAKGIEIDRLAVGDLGGATLAVKGRIGTQSRSPHGMLTLDLDARALDGVTSLVEKFAPQAADRLRRAVTGETPAALRATLSIDPGASGSADARFRIDGRAGQLRVALQGDGRATADALSIANIAALGAAKVNLSGLLEAEDGAALIGLLGLDRFTAVDNRPARLTLEAVGPLDGQLAVEGRLAAGTLNASTNGTFRLAPPASPNGGSNGASNWRPSAGLDLRIANANIRSLRPPAAGRPAEFLPTSVTARVTVTEGVLRLTDMKGTMAGTNFAGRLAIGMQAQPFAVEGDIEVMALELPSAIATAIGIPAAGAGAGAGGNGGSPGHWPAEPFEPVFNRVSGQVALRVARLAITPKLAGRDARAILRFAETELALRSIEGSVAGGRLTGELTFTRHSEGLTALGRIGLAGVNASELLPGEGLIGGRLTLDVTAEGTGMSTVALVGALGGNGSFTLENGRLARLDPAAFDAIIRAVDQGLPIDTGKVRDRIDSALSGGGLPIVLAEGAIIINAGQARLSNASVRANGADLDVNGSVSLAESAVDARLTLAGTGGAATARPEIVIALKGPIEAPRRSVDVATLASWLALRAVDQQSKKLDILEGRGSPAPSTPPAGPVPGSTTVPSVLTPPSSPTPSASTQSAPVPTPSIQIAPARAAPAAPAARAAPGTDPDIIRPRQPSRTAAPGTPKQKSPAAEQAQPLPPPIDIRPAATPRVPRTQTGPQGAAAAQPQPAKPAAPPPARPRSLSEILFGR